MSLFAKSPDPQRWNWQLWLQGMSAYLARHWRKEEVYRQYRVYIDNRHSHYLGQIVTKDGFYSAYLEACHRYGLFKDTLSIVDMQTGDMM